MLDEGNKLAAKIAAPLTRKLLSLDRNGSFRNRFLVTSEPAIPPIILRDDAAFSQLSCRLAKMQFVAQHQFCIAKLFDFIVKERFGSM